MNREEKEFAPLITGARTQKPSLIRRLEARQTPEVRDKKHLLEIEKNRAYFHQVLGEDYLERVAMAAERKTWGITWPSVSRQLLP